MNKGVYEVSQQASTAIVTGAAKGLGRAIADKLASVGFSLLLVDRNEQDLHDTVVELGKSGTSVASYAVDLTEPQAADVVVAAADREFGGASVLVNNAGIVPFRGFLETPLDLLREVLTNDVETVYTMTQAFVRSRISKAEGGCVINLGTGHALTGVGGTSAYAAAKGAVHALTRALAVELAPHGIRVNTLALGTTMTDRVRANLPDEVLRARLRQIPLGRAADPGEAADAVLYLIRAGYATGTELVLDGGFTIFGDS